MYEKAASWRKVKFSLFFLGLLGNPPFFVYCRMCFLILGRSAGIKKHKNKKKWIRRLELGGPVPQHNIREVWKQEDMVTKSTWRQWRKDKSTSWLNSNENSVKRMNHYLK